MSRWYLPAGKVHNDKVPVPYTRRFVFVLMLAGVTPVTAQLQPARIIILIGPPGSGKTVQAKNLQKRYKVPAISMAQVLQEARRSSPMGKALASSLDSGELVADGPANELMRTRLQRPDAGRGFILDGYPTSEGQAKALDELLVEHQFPKPTVVILDVPEDVVKERLRERGRSDDSPANIDRRLRDYREVGRMVEQWYGSARMVRVNGTGTPDEVASRMVNGIDSAVSTQELKVRSREGEGLKKRPPAEAPKPDQE